MAYWLLKTEPSDYSFADFQQDRKTPWTGVANALALKHLRTMAKGDQVLIYHTGNQKAAVGIGNVVKAAYAPAGSDDPKAVAVDIAAGEPLPAPVPLARIKADPRLADCDLLRLSRLSVVPLTRTHWSALLDLAKGAA